MITRYISKQVEINVAAIALLWRTLYRKVTCIVVLCCRNSGARIHSCRINLRNPRCSYSRITMAPLDAPTLFNAISELTHSHLPRFSSTNEFNRDSSPKFMLSIFSKRVCPYKFISRSLIFISRNFATGISSFTNTSAFIHYSFVSSIAIYYTIS